MEHIFPEHEGTLFVSPKGTGYVRVKDLKDSVEVKNEDLATGLNGDKVRVKITGSTIYETPTGEIVEIITRSKKGFAGTLTIIEQKYYVEPSDPKTHIKIYIPEDALNGAVRGQKVFAGITHWKEQDATPRGEILQVLGNPMDNNAEMRGIALEKGFDAHFPKTVEEEALALKAEGMPEAAVALRRDIRGITTFTIDPKDAKDFDDALSIRTLENGNTEVGIHIADVSHYVRPGTALDKEAYRRSTSVYLVDRTIPMLPEVLSNDLCSLNPHEDKFTFSAIFELNQNAEVQNEWFGRTVMHSDHRFAYEDAQAVLDKGEGIYFSELHTLNTLAKKLTEARFAAGALSLDQDEVKFVLDENGVPLSVYKKERGDTNRLIEEFMLLANRKVAEYIAKKSKIKENVFVYRVHDLPNKEKMYELSLFLKKLGYKVTLNDEGVIPSKELNTLLEQLEGKEEKNTVHSAVIRSMAKAVYSTENIGHYGLAFEFYTHFTSPIRRYPDTMVHRLLADYLEGKEVPKEMWDEYQRICEYASGQEKEASEAERTSIKYKQVEYMSYHIGETFDSVVTGLSKNGVFVEEKETKCEGMIRLKDLGKDFFSFNDKDNTVSGTRTKETFKIGDTFKIKVANADIYKRMIDYVRVS